MKNTEFDILIGKNIDKILIDNDKTFIVFICVNDKFIFCCSGDCCSESWINHLNGLGNLIGNTIISIEDKEYSDVPGTRQEYDKSYVFTFKTNKGYFDLEMRNSSNGYYGGDIGYIEKWGGKPVNENSSLWVEHNFTELTEDF